MVYICQQPRQKARRLSSRLVTGMFFLVWLLSTFLSFPNALLFVSLPTRFGKEQCHVFS
jgi:hypothetical protein